MLSGALDTDPRATDEAVRRTIEKIRSFHAAPSDERARKGATMAAVAKLFRDIGAADVAGVITEIVVAIDDLDRGRVADWLKPSLGGGRPPDAAIVWLRRARIVAVAELLHAGGATLEAAATEAAKLVLAKIKKQKTSVKSLKKEVTANNILVWRRALVEKSANCFACQFYSESVDEFVRARKAGIDIKDKSAIDRYVTENIREKAGY